MQNSITNVYFDSGYDQLGYYWVNKNAFQKPTVSHHNYE